MRNFNALAAVAAFSVLLGSAAVAADRTTGSAIFVNPNTQAYVGTFVQDCSNSYSKGYVGVYLAQSFDIQGSAMLGVATLSRSVFTASPRAKGEEAWATEIGGQSKLSCLPIGTKVYLLSSPGGNLPITVLGIGTVT
jgi:hypothetical protein